MVWTRGLPPARLGSQWLVTRILGTSGKDCLPGEARCHAPARARDSGGQCKAARALADSICLFTSHITRSCIVQHTRRTLTVRFFSRGSEGTGMGMSERDIAHVFERLRSGVVPERGLEMFAVGIDKKRAEI